VACLLQVYDHHHIHPKVPLPSMVMRLFKAGSVFGSVFKEGSVFKAGSVFFSLGSTLPKNAPFGSALRERERGGGGCSPVKSLCLASMRAKSATEVELGCLGGRVVAIVIVERERRVGHSLPNSARTKSGEAECPYTTPSSRTSYRTTVVLANSRGRRRPNLSILRLRSAQIQA
jgi:hypothetical protein